MKRGTCLLEDQAKALVFYCALVELTSVIDTFPGIIYTHTYRHLPFTRAALPEPPRTYALFTCVSLQIHHGDRIDLET